MKQINRLLLIVATLFTTLPSHALSVQAEKCANTQQEDFIGWQGDWDSYCVPVYYNDTVAIGKKGDKKAVFDIVQKKQLSDFIYDDIDYWNDYFIGYDKVFTFKRDGKVGVLDSNGKETVFKGDFDRVENFVNGIGIAEKNGKYGTVDLQGNVIIPLEYGYMNPYHYGFTNIDKNGKQTFVDTKGNLLTPFRYDTVYYFGKNGLAPVAYNKDGVQKFTYNIGDKKFALLNRQGKEVTPFIYDDAHPTDEAVTIVIKKSMTREPDKFGLVNAQGKLIAPMIYEDRYLLGGQLTEFNEHFLLAYDSITDNYGVFDTHGNASVPFKYGYLSPIYDGLMIFSREKQDPNRHPIVGKIIGKQGVIDVHNRVIIPAIYDGIKFTQDDKIQAVKNGKVWYFDKTGKPIKN